MLYNVLNSRYNWLFPCDWLSLNILAKIIYRSSVNNLIQSEIHEVNIFIHSLEMKKSPAIMPFDTSLMNIKTVKLHRL